MPSYAVIVPDSQLLINVNAQLDDHHTFHVDRVLVITRSVTESAIKIQEYEECVHSMLLVGWHAYRTICMEFTTDHKSVATARLLLDGSQLFGDERDVEGVMMIARLVMQHVCGCTNGVSDEKIQEHSVEIIRGKDNEAEEEEICVICQKEFEAGEMCETLECGHWYHKKCIYEWLRHANFCPICREMIV